MNNSTHWLFLDRYNNMVYRSSTVLAQALGVSHTTILRKSSNSNNIREPVTIIRNDDLEEHYIMKVTYPYILDDWFTFYNESPLYDNHEWLYNETRDEYYFTAIEAQYALNVDEQKIRRCIEKGVAVNKRNKLIKVKKPAGSVKNSELHTCQPYGYRPIKW